jgi:zinc transport system substrate-binding protein
MFKKIIYVIPVSLFCFINFALAFEKITISAGISPVSSLIKSISASDKIFTLLPENASPASYDLTPSQLLQVMKSDFFFTAGTPFERHIVSKLSKIEKKVVIIDLSKDLDLLHLPHAGHDHKCSASDFDPHFWLSPDLMSKAMATVTRTLINFRPENRETYQRKYEKLKIRLKNLKTEMNSLLADCRGKSMFVYHPAFGYLTDPRGIKQISIENLGKKPGARHLKEYLETAKANNIKSIFVQKQFPVKTALSLSRYLKCKIVYLDPMVDDYFADIIDLCSTLKNSL